MSSEAPSPANAAESVAAARIRSALAAAGLEPEGDRVRRLVRVTGHLEPPLAAVRAKVAAEHAFSPAFAAFGAARDEER